MALDRIQTGLRLEEEMLLKITYIAKKNRRSFNAQMELLIDECIEAYEKDNGAIPIDEKEKYRYSR